MPEREGPRTYKGREVRRFSDAVAMRLVIELRCWICHRKNVVDPAELLPLHGDREIDRVRWKCTCGVRCAHVFLGSKD